MKWEVHGAVPSTGEDVIISIEADTRESAERRAARRGIMVASILPSGELSAQDSGVFPTGAPDVPPPIEESRSQIAARMSGGKAVPFVGRRPPDTHKIKKYVDPLAWPRLVMLLVAIGYSLLCARGADVIFAYMLWGAWIALGLVGIVQKANWKARS